jgi:hypothetical protein
MGGDFVPYTSNFDLDGGYRSSIPTDFKSNEQISREETLLYNKHTQQYVLNEPGIYEFQTTMTVNLFNVSSKYYKSNIVQIRVVEPPNKDKAALKALKKYNLGYFLNGITYPSRYLFDDSFEDLEDSIEKSILFLRDYRHSFYAPLVLRLLKYNLYNIERELELTKQAQSEELSSELEVIYNKTKNFTERVKAEFD